MEREWDPQDPSVGMPDDKEIEETPSGPEGEIAREEDTSGGPLSGGAGEGSGHGAGDAPDVDVPGGSDEGV